MKDELERIWKDVFHDYFFVSRVNTVSATAVISALWQCVTLPFECLEVINVLYLTYHALGVHV